jgi:threonine dehydratase
MITLPTYEDVVAARTRIAPAVRRTPLLPCPALGPRVLVKAECLQRFGAFKIRGAYNRIASLPAAERRRGVLAFSSGNHAMAVAGAARAFGAPAVIVMPADAPGVKREATAALGAEIVAYDRLSEDREAIGLRLARARGLALVRPFDDPLVIAGQGTIGIEIAEEAAPDLVLVPASGGGLGTGVATALATAAPGAKVILVEPESHDDFARSLASGRREKNAPGARSICDALMVDQPGEITFALAQRHGVTATTVSDEEVLKAMAFAFRELKIVVEPGGAAALAAALSGRVELADKSVVIIASGGNVDAATFVRALSAGL